MMMVSASSLRTRAYSIRHEPFCSPRASSLLIERRTQNAERRTQNVEVVFFLNSAFCILRSAFISLFRRDQVREQLVRPRHACRQLAEPVVRGIDVDALSISRVQLAAEFLRLAGIVRHQRRLVARVPVAREI